MAAAPERSRYQSRAGERNFPVTRALEFSPEHELDPPRRSRSHSARVDHTRNASETAADHGRIAGERPKATRRILKIGWFSTLYAAARKFRRRRSVIRNRF